MDAVRSGVLRALSLDAENYPLEGFEDELALLDAVVNSKEALKTGSSTLLVGPNQAAKRALLQRTLDQLSRNNNGQHRTIHLHGALYSETQVLLRRLERELQGQNLHSYEELSECIKEWLQQHRNYRLVLVLDAFDRFALGTPKFLYTIFELAAYHPILIIGLSMRCDAVDLMEKRVKSRFSQNIILVPYPCTFQHYLQMIRTCLLPPSAERHSHYRQSVEDVLAEEHILDYLENSYEISHDPTSTLDIFVEAACQISQQQPRLDPSLIIASIERMTEDGQDGLRAEYCVLVALRRATLKDPSQPISFDILYEEYRNGFATSPKVTEGTMLAQKFTRSVMRSAVESLIAKRHLRPSKPSSPLAATLTTINTREELHSTLPIDQIPDVLKNTPQCPSPLKRLAAEIL